MTTTIRGSDNFDSASVGLQSQQVFTSSGTWTKPSGIKTIKVYITGAGSGSTNSSNAYHAGGSGGGTAIKIIDVSSISSVTVTIGSGGASTLSTTTSGAGGSSSFGSHCSATGGAGQIWWDGGAGGVGSGGDVNLQGQGGVLTNTQGNDSSRGGDSFWGGGGAGTEANTETARLNTIGNHGGGGGAWDQALTTGGTGGSGICVVEEYS